MTGSKRKPAAEKSTPAHVLVLRVCRPNGESHNGFRWPMHGPVKCDDWDPTPECGGGLHGWLWGEGDASAASWDLNATDNRWLVVRVRADEIVDLSGKVKFPRGTVVHCGTAETATAYLVAHGGAGRAIIRGTATAGDYGTATAGDYGTATAGDRGELRIRYWDGSRCRLAVGYVGEDGIEAGKRYQVDDGRLVEVPL